MMPRVNDQVEIADTGVYGIFEGRFIADEYPKNQKGEFTHGLVRISFNVFTADEQRALLKVADHIFPNIFAVPIDQIKVFQHGRSKDQTRKGSRKRTE